MDDFWILLSHLVTFITACKYSWGALKFIFKWLKRYKKIPKNHRRELK